MMARLYFITGSQDLYGEETLKQVADDSKIMAAYLNDQLKDVVNIAWKPHGAQLWGDREHLPRSLRG